MNTLNLVLTRLTDWLLAPLAWSPLLALVFWSAVAGFLMALVFRHTSNQIALKRVADRIRADLLAMKLFKDDLTVTLRVQRSLFKHIGLRLLHSLPPMLVMLVPSVFALAQLAARYEHRPLRPGESAVVEVQLTEKHWETGQNLALEVPQGVTVQTPRVRDAYHRTVAWRIRAETNGRKALRWRLPDRVIEKTLTVADNPRHLVATSVYRPGTRLSDRLLYPSEPGFDAASPVQAIRLHYSSARTTPIFGLDVHWLITFIVLSMLFALASRLFIRVQF